MPCRAGLNHGFAEDVSTGLSGYSLSKSSRTARGSLLAVVLSIAVEGERRIDQENADEHEHESGPLRLLLCRLRPAEVGADAAKERREVESVQPLAPPGQLFFDLAGPRRADELASGQGFVQVEHAECVGCKLLLH